MDDPAEVEHRANELARHQARSARGFDHKPANRRCLKCGTQFESAGAHNRLCELCRPRVGAGLYENVEYLTGNWSDGTGED